MLTFRFLRGLKNAPVRLISVCTDGLFLHFLLEGKGSDAVRD